ncbi:MAG: hypothetical protein Q9160_002934 [Pyrenula sp. 1 TL-2023]
MEDQRRPLSSRPVSAISYQDSEELAPPLPVANHPSKSENESSISSKERVSSQREDVSDIANPEARPSNRHVQATSTKLHRSMYVLLLVCFYATLTLVAWVATAILTIRPITAKHYGVWIRNKENNGYGWVGANRYHSLYIKNENWYRTARVLQAIASVLTIPLTSAVCSSAAVIFCQRAQNPSLRQMISLADKGWTDPTTWIRTVIKSNGFKRYGSSLLYGSMALVALGGIISPIQQVFLTTKTIKTPTWPQLIPDLLDIPDQWWYLKYSDYSDSNLVTVKTRSALISATNTQPQASLWQGAGFACSMLDVLKLADNKTTSGSVPRACGKGATFGNMSTLTDPFLAELPSGYSTGVIRQFAPRFNSTAKYEAISQEDFPTDCQNQHGAFWVEYGNLTSNDFDESTFSLTACMPSDQSKSPWKNTRDRQDFSEELYINVSIVHTAWPDVRPSPAGGDLFKVTANTTAGYFELPNYMNNGVPALGLSTVINKGPLLTVTMALFGEGSFLQTRLTHPAAYYGIDTSEYDEDRSKAPPTNIGACIDLAPLGSLLDDDIGQHVIGNNVDYCIKNTDGGTGGTTIERDMVFWIENFRYRPERLSNAFTASLFLANQAWMFEGATSGHRSLRVSYDEGADTEVPVMSTRAVILISVLLGIDLIALFLLALYASWWPRWTGQLDAFTMMRVGAAVAENVPLKVGRSTDQIQVLDGLPGWMGDAGEAEDGQEPKIGELALGGRKRLRGGRRYGCYAGDAEPVGWELKRNMRERIREEGAIGLNAAGPRT